MIDNDDERPRSLPDDPLCSMGLTAALMLQAAEMTRQLSMTDPVKQPRMRLMRLTEIHRDSVRIDDGRTALRATVATALSRRLGQTQSMLTVGDWVLAAADDDGQHRLHHRLTPTNQLIRRDANGVRQALVSNFDCALLTMGLDKDFNPRRIERYVTLLQSTDARIVIVLTKADTLIDPRSLFSHLRTLRERIGNGLPILCVDARDSDTAVRLQPFLQPGQTLVVLGSSGAGKSTLTNTLFGQLVQDTGAAREHDNRGKHTTRSRSLFRLPGGACIIDTPGLRGLRAEADKSHVAAAFGEIQMLAAGCRFRDCRHQNEPGCRVREAVDEDRLNNYQKLVREVRRDQAGHLERRTELGVWKARSRARRQAQKTRVSG